MQKPEMAMAGLVSNPKNAMLIGATITPPPMPPAAHIVIKMKRATTPKPSMSFPGKTGLC
jgi:hypothetical protein